MPENLSRKSNSGVWYALLREARLVGRLLLDKRVPWYLKLLPIGAVVYAISPVDLLPLNPLDDAALLSVAFYFFVELCPPEVVEEHRQAMKRIWRESSATDKSPDTKA